MRSKLVLEKIHNNEKSEEDNSRHQKQPVQRPWGQRTRGRTMDWKKGGLYGPEGKEWEACPGSGLKRETGAIGCRASEAQSRDILLWEPWEAQEGCWCAVQWQWDHSILRRFPDFLQGSLSTISTQRLSFWPQLCHYSLGGSHILLSISFLTWKMLATPF